MSDRSAVFYYVALLDEGGKADPVDLTRRVENFQFVDREGGMDKLTLTVDNRDLANFDDPLFEYGSKIRVAFGNGRAASPVRDMVIRKVTGGRTLTVEAVTKKGSALDTIKKRRRFENVRRSDVVRQIAKENGFNNPDVEETTEVFQSISQSNLTDGQLMRKLASIEGFELYVDYDGLHWHRRRVDQAPAKEYVYYTDPTGGEILDFTIENDITRRPARVTVKSRDPKAKEDIEASASNSEDRDREVLAGYTATVDGESGAVVVKKEIVQETTVASNVQTQEDADRTAKGKYRKAQQGCVKLSLQLRGDPSLVAKTVIKVSNMGKRISGKYYVKEVTHSLDAGGGYDMAAKLITDGFQGGKGKGKGAADGAAGLVGLADALRQAGTNDVSSAVDGESGSVEVQENPALLNKQLGIQKQAEALSDVLKALSTQQGDQLSTNAQRAAGALAKLASNARSVGAVSTASTASEAAALCRRLAQSPGEIEAQGKKNKKDVNASKVRAVKSMNADGQEVTTYVNTGGREK